MSENIEKPPVRERLPFSQLWQIPTVLLALLVFFVASYIARHPIKLSSPKAADFTALAMAYETGDAAAAVSSAERFLDRYPSGDSEGFARFVLAFGKWSFLRGSAAATRAELDDCLSLFRRAQVLGLAPAYEAQVLRSQGELLLRLGLPAEAAVTYSALLEKYPSERPALLGFALACLERQPPELEKARDTVEKYLAIDGLSTDQVQSGYLAKARVEMASKDFENAAQSARSVLDSNAPPLIQAEAGLILQQALLERGDLAAALAALDRIPINDSGPLQGAVLIARGRCLWQAANRDEALRSLEEAILTFPGTADALSARYYLSRFFFQTKQIDAAKDALVNLLDEMSAQQVVETPHFTIGDVTDLWFDVGRAILEARDYRAVRDFHAAARVLMSQGHFLFFDGTLYLREAEQQEILLAGLPSQQVEAARAHIRLLYRDAAAAFVKGLETASGPVFTHCLFNAGHASFLAGDYPAAARLLKSFAASAPNDERVPQSYYECSCALAALGNYRSAIEVCQLNARSFPTNIYAYRSLLLTGDMYFRLGGQDMKLAADTYAGILTDARFLSASVEWRRAIFALGRTLYLLGDCRGAMLRLDEALHRFPDDPEVPRAQYYRALVSRQAAFADPSLKLELLASAASDFAEISAGQSPYAEQAVFFEADCYYDLGDYQKALYLYDRAVEAHVDTVEATRALFQIANCYYRLGRREEAEATYKRALFNLDRRQVAPVPGAGFYRSLDAWRSNREAGT